jgi:hypothetical protein
MCCDHLRDIQKDKQMNTEETQIAVMPTASMSLAAGASVQEVVKRAQLIDQVLKNVMHKGQHYDVIPGTGDKPSLLKSGAEKLCALFNLGCELDVDRMELPEGHREYLVTCTIKHYPTSMIIGEGVGSCSTMESKYRYRNVADYTVIDGHIPGDFKEKKSEYRRKGFGAKKVDGEWHWVKYGDDVKSQNPDLADTFNTVLKMAKKRALVDAVLTATGASDLFTQDVEEFTHLAPEESELPQRPKPKAEKIPLITEVEWQSTVTDIKEEERGEGDDKKVFYCVKFANGKDAWTVNRDLAGKAFEFIPDEGEDAKTVKASAKLGKKGSTWWLETLEEV